MSYDFSGWATKNDLKCADGRTIRRNAFKESDGRVVPLVWQHLHNDPSNILGHALLENRDSGVYAYCTFNDTDSAVIAKNLVQHGDIKSLSIYANNLKQNGGDVLHGSIREVSLVLSGANPGACIDYLAIEHSEDSDPEEAIIYTDEEIAFAHSEEPVVEEDQNGTDLKLEHKEEGKEMPSEKTVKDVFDSLSEEQKNVVYFLIGSAVEEAKGGKEGSDDVKHNIFEGDDSYAATNVLTHSQIDTIFADAKRYGSLKESFLAHAAEYGIDHIDYLFPDYKTLENHPDFIQREMDWVPKVMNAVHHTPFSRIKSIHADITEDEARARGYIKGNLKKEEVFTLLKRTTDPQTIYKKQKLERDDVVDITDFDVVSWLKTEMRMMLNEELARAILVGDDRLSSSNDKIQQAHIRSVWQDDDLYTVKVPFVAESGVAAAKTFIKTCIKSRKEYKGSGNPTLFLSEDMLTDMLLLEDGIGHLLYPSVSVLATTLRVKEIITVPVMESFTHPRIDRSGKKWTPLGIIVNLHDYNVGADKGGAVDLFEDFDVDYNQMKYLIETRCSGALTKPFSALAIEQEVTDEAGE